VTEVVIGAKLSGRLGRPPTDAPTPAPAKENNADDPKKKKKAAKKAKAEKTEAAKFEALRAEAYEPRVDF
jgi:uncharacterized protein YdbL (DUF1318 family)